MWILWYLYGYLTLFVQVDKSLDQRCSESCCAGYNSRLFLIQLSTDSSELFSGFFEWSVSLLVRNEQKNLFYLHYTNYYMMSSLFVFLLQSLTACSLLCVLLIVSTAYQ